MQSDSEVIRHLNQVLRNSLTAINQYFLHARMYANWGFGELDERAYKQSIKEMKLSDRLIQRVLFLEGLPNLQDLDKLLIGEGVTEILSNDLKLERDHRSAAQAAIAHMESVQDFVSRELLEDILEAKEDYIDWLETQLGLIESIELPRYLQSQIENE